MKKIIYVLLLFFLGITTSHAERVTATFTATFLSRYHYVDSNGKFGDFEMFKRAGESDRVAYCVEPGLSMAKTAYIGLYNASTEELANHINLSKETLKTISEIAYFGYGYKDHTSTEWIIATQAKIWNVLGRKFQFTSRNSEANPWAYVIETPIEIKEKMEELERLIKNYQTKPSINGQNILLSLGENYSYKDSSLINYNLITNNEFVEKKNDEITIQANKIGKYNVSLEKKETNYQQEFIVFHHDNGQDLFLTGNIPSQSIAFSHEVVAGKVKILKYDADNKTCKPQENTSLDGAVFGLFLENGTKLKEITIKNCEGIFEGLALGSYYIQELKAPIGYELKKEKYSFTITKENMKNTQTLTIYNKVMSTKLNINKKYLQENKIEISEEGSVFEVISEATNKVVATLKTDKQGNASITLPYGSYILKQVKGKNGYHFVANQKILVNKKSEDITNIFLLNKPILKEIKIIKKETDTNKKLAIPGFEFKLFDIVNQKYLCQNKECTYKTNEDGEIIIKDLYYSIYRLEEVKKAIPGYAWNKKPLEFILNEKNEEITILEFYNKRVKGFIEIKKTDDLEKPLANIEFALYAKTDIYEHDQLIYKKEELIAILRTNHLGIATIENLPLGEYYLKENSKIEGFAPNEETYDISLLYQDEGTPIIKKTLEIINFKIPITKKDDIYSLLSEISLGLGLLLYEKKKYSLL